MRLGVFAVLVFIAIGYLSNSKSNITLPSVDNLKPYLGNFNPQIEQGQKWLETEINKLKKSAVDQALEKIKSSILK